jgi:hypothetical protein
VRGCRYESMGGLNQDPGGGPEPRLRAAGAVRVQEPEQHMADEEHHAFD